MIKPLSTTILCILLLFFFEQAFAQKQHTGISKCATMQAIENRYATDPAFRARMQKGLEEAQQSILEQPPTILNDNIIDQPVIIPVVVHIVLQDPRLITDEDVYRFIERLNDDFSGNNADSTNASAFYPVRGRSMIRFTLARRDPQGNFTTGILRKTSPVTIGVAEPQAIKTNNAQGSDPWPVQDYYNIWVGTGPDGVLGIAPEIGPGSTNSDGVCIDFRAFSNNPCYGNMDYALSRTAVHEIGHNFGLYHIFEGGCNFTNDFRQLTSATLSLPATYLSPLDDTPNQSDPTIGCPSGIVDAGCAGSPNPPGKMYQNYMDYTGDQCYSLFTRGQVERMHWVLLNGRPGYLQTKGHLPPDNAPLNDAELNEVINPGGREIISGSCTSYTMPFCPGTITPKVRIINRGTEILSSVTAGVMVNNESPLSKTFHVNLAYGQSMVVELEAINISYGENKIKFFTANPNNNADQQLLNDTIELNISLAEPATGNIEEGFEEIDFPPNGWTVRNNGTPNTWQRATTGYNSNASAFIDNYNNENLTEMDDLISPSFSTEGLDSLIIEFDLAHKYYPGTADRLTVYITGDCGITATAIYSKTGSQLATAGSSTEEFTQPVLADWRKEKIVLGKNQFANGVVQLIFRNMNDWGNNIFIDNITVTPVKLVKRDLELVSVLSPAHVECTGNIAPVILVKNRGSETIRTARLNYTINNGTAVSTEVNDLELGTGQSSSLILSATNLSPGQYDITVYLEALSSVEGNGDEQPVNDTLRKSVGIAGQISAPLIQDFQEASFPPSNWAIANSDNQLTWEKATLNNGAAVIRNFQYPTNGQRDELYSPVISIPEIDSLFLKFDVAAIANTFGERDTLEVLVTNDCGNSFTTVYQKWGSELQTTTMPVVGEFVPQANEWRRDSINLTGFINQAPLQVVFRNINQHKNNIYLDNIEVSTKVLPDRLKQDGYLLLPNPFRETFSIWHYRLPVALKAVTVYNAFGQMIWQKEYRGNAPTLIPVDLTGKAPGIYFVHLEYTNAGTNTSVKLVKY